MCETIRKQQLVFSQVIMCHCNLEPRFCSHSCQKSCSNVCSHLPSCLSKCELAGTPAALCHMYCSVRCAMPVPWLISPLGVSLLLGLGGCTNVCKSTCGAMAPGDILIGVLSSCYASVEALNERTQPQRFICTE